MNNSRRSRMPTGIRRGAAVMLLAAATVLAGCDFQLDLTNPNALAEQEVVTDATGIVSVAVGMQAQYSSDFEDFVQAPALVTDEWGTTTRALLAYTTLVIGEGLRRTYVTVEAPWSGSYSVIRAANTLLENAPQVDLEPGTRTGIIALAKLFKGMAFGTLYRHYERAPVEVEVESPEPVDRTVVLDTAIALLESARAELEGVSRADLDIFRSRVLGDGFDFRNTINARLARFYLFDGRYEQAIAAAQRVDLGVVSIFPYQSPDENPIHDLAFDAGYVQGLAQFVTEAESGDQRVPYWVKPDDFFSGNPTFVVLVEFNQYDSPTDPIPVYIPDEMRLIQAEAYTRLGQFARARELINAVRTQTAAEPAEALVPKAGLDPLAPEALDTEAELLTQIAYGRRYELYMQGVRWEDTRRLDPYIETEPTYEFLPIPRQECITNEAVGC